MLLHVGDRKIGMRSDYLVDDILLMIIHAELDTHHIVSLNHISEYVGCNTSFGFFFSSLISSPNYRQILNERMNSKLERIRRELKSTYTQYTHLNELPDLFSS